VIVVSDLAASEVVALASLDGVLVSVAGPVVGILALDSAGTGLDGDRASDGPTGEFRGVIPTGPGTHIGIPTGTIHFRPGVTPLIRARSSHRDAKSSSE
jgi:hypothetical protein